MEPVPSGGAAGNWSRSLKHFAESGDRRPEAKPSWLTKYLAQNEIWEFTLNCLFSPSATKLLRLASWTRGPEQKGVQRLPDVPEDVLVGKPSKERISPKWSIAISPTTSQNASSRKWISSKYLDLERLTPEKTKIKAKIIQL